MQPKPLFKECPVCGTPVELISSRESAYTVFRCRECGPYSLTNELVNDLVTRKVPVPDKEVFREWLKREPVIDSLKGQGPLITAGTFGKIRMSLH